MESILLVIVWYSDSKNRCCLEWHHKANPFMPPSRLQQQRTAVLSKYMTSISVSLTASIYHMQTARALSPVQQPGHKFVDGISTKMRKRQVVLVKVRCCTVHLLNWHGLALSLPGYTQSLEHWLRCVLGGLSASRYCSEMSIAC